MHISTACPGGTLPGQPGGNEGEFGILSVGGGRIARELCRLETSSCISDTHRLLMFYLVLIDILS
jgi:hypothetical protein